MISGTEGIRAADVLGRIERLARFGIPALLLFVSSRGGVSHSPDESTSDADLVAGVRFTDALCRRLAAHPPA